MYVYVCIAVCFMLQDIHSQSGEGGERQSGGGDGGGERRRRRKPVLKELSSYDMEEGVSDTHTHTHTHTHTQHLS